MKYQIGSQVATLIAKASGKPFKKFNVKDEKGVITPEVVSFDYFTQFSKIESGASIEGVLQESDYNGQKSYKLVDGNLGAKPAGFGKVAMEAKAKSIEKAQDRKEEGIFVSSTARDATAIVTAFYPEMALLPSGKEKDIEIQKVWRRARKWLMDNWEPQDTTSDGSLMPNFDVVTPTEPKKDIFPEEMPW